MSDFTGRSTCFFKKRGVGSGELCRSNYCTGYRQTSFVRTLFYTAQQDRPKSIHVLLS